MMGHHSPLPTLQGPHFHILAYVIPGPQGETEAGRRRVNWVWYWNASDEELQDYLTDIHGFRHGHSVKKGLLRQVVLELVGMGDKLKEGGEGGAALSQRVCL